MKSNLEVDILKILLSPPYEEDISVRQIAKKLNRPSSHIFYYLKKMHRQGILTKEEVGDRGFYKPQPIFGCDIEQTLHCLKMLAVDIQEPTGEKVANCIRVFLKINKFRR